MSGAYAGAGRRSSTEAHRTRCAAFASSSTCGLLGGEGLDDPDAVDVLVDDRRDVGHARLHDPRQRERLRCRMLDAGDVHERASSRARRASGRRGS